MTDAKRVTASGLPSGAGARFRHTDQIEWAETDAAGQFHYPTAFLLFERAEVRLLEELGMADDVYGRMPRVSVQADFRRPLLFRDRVEVTVWVDAVGTSSLTYGFLIHKAGELCVTGRVVTVLLTEPRGRPEPWSDAYRRRLMPDPS